MIDFPDMWRRESLPFQKGLKLNTVLITLISLLSLNTSLKSTADDIMSPDRSDGKTDYWAQHTCLSTCIYVQYMPTAISG